MFQAIAILGWLTSMFPSAATQSPRGVARLTMNDNTLEIEYGRPRLQGRDMLESAPVGTVWRLGADQSTTMTVKGVVVFGNMVLWTGAYSVFLERVAEDRWMLVVNKQSGQWGTEHDPKQDLLGVPLKWEKQDAPTEELTIELAKESGEMGILSIRWGHDLLRQLVRFPKT